MRAERRVAGRPSCQTDWVGELKASHVPAPAEAALTAIRFAPDADSFFNGDDPLARMADLPGLLALQPGAGRRVAGACRARPVRVPVWSSPR